MYKKKSDERKEEFKWKMKEIRLKRMMTDYECVYVCMLMCWLLSFFFCYVLSSLVTRIEHNANFKKSKRFKEKNLIQNDSVDNSGAAKEWSTALTEGTFEAF